MRALIIDKSIIAEAQAVKKYASEHIYSIADLMAINNGTLPPPGDLPFFVIKIQVGYRAVYSQEQQMNGLYHHLSVSVDTKDKLPSVPATIAICELFGMSGEWEESVINFEKMDGEIVAISIHELIVSSQPS